MRRPWYPSRSLGIVAAAAAGAALLGAITVRRGNILALVTPAGLGVMALVGLCSLMRGSVEPSARERLLRWTLLAFGLHLLVGLVINSLPAAVEYFGADALSYHGGAQAIADGWKSGTPMPHLPSGKEGFYYLLGGLYWFFGNYAWAGIAVNAVLAAALVPIVSDTTARLFGPRPVRYVAPLVVLVPGFLVWTSQLLKEAPIVFLVAVAANCAVRLLDRVSFLPMAFLTVAAALLFTFRGPVGLFLAVGMVLGLALARQKVVSGVLVAACVATLMAVAMASSGVGVSGYQKTVTSDLEHVNSVRQGLAQSASSGFQVDADVSTPTRALSYLPVGLASFALGPFPWQIQQGRHLPGLVDALVWWVLLVALCRGLRAGHDLVGRRLLVLLVPAIAMWAPLSLVISNYGTVARERIQVIVLLVPLIALGLSLRAGRERVTEAEPEKALAPR